MLRKKSISVLLPLVAFFIVGCDSSNGQENGIDPVLSAQLKCGGLSEVSVYAVDEEINKTTVDWNMNANNDIDSVAFQVDEFTTAIGIRKWEVGGADEAVPKEAIYFYVQKGEAGNYVICDVVYRQFLSKDQITSTYAISGTLNISKFNEGDALENYINAGSFDLAVNWLEGSASKSAIDVMKALTYENTQMNFKGSYFIKGIKIPKK
jgi:hypothetical protein